MNNNIFNLLNGLMCNPVQTLNRSGFNIPQNMNSPQEIIQYLLNSGQITQAQVNDAMQMRNSPIFGTFK